ncbi:helix-turn-helix transcriptional regulator [Clostridium sp. UBA3887]|uniref:helix-turn-helix domain-containing protein n=1 Tax=Clostridium sp. UBA3887 TaxID=1946356 RepID=UPI0032169D20
MNISVRALGKYLRNCRELRGLTREELSEKSGIEIDKITDYECGKLLFNAYDTHRLITAFGISIDEFFDGLVSPFKSEHQRNLMKYSDEELLNELLRRKN